MYFVLVDEEIPIVLVNCPPLSDTLTQHATPSKVHTKEFL